MKHLILISALLVAPATSHAWKPEVDDQGYSKIITQCIAGVVVARSITTMIQLNDPKTGTPMKCQDLEAAKALNEALVRIQQTTKKMQEEIDSIVEENQR